MSGRMPAAKRYNARGERRCADCGAYRHVSWFGKRTESADGLHPYCRPCINRRNRGYKATTYLDDAVWRDVNRANVDRKARRRAERRAEQWAFAAAAVRRLREQGFTFDELAALSGINRHTLSRYVRAAAPTRGFGRTGVIPKLERLVAATGDLPRRPMGRPRRGQPRPPHPALGLVQARLDRMAWLQELDQAA